MSPLAYLGFRQLIANRKVGLPLFLDQGDVFQVPVEPPPLPTAEMLAEVTVELYNGGESRPDVPPFKLPREYIEPLLESFKEPVFYPIKLGRECGSLKFVYRDGQVGRLSWRASGKSTINFTLGGLPCARAGERYEEYGDEGGYLDGLLRAIYQSQTGANAGIAEYSLYLYQSDGEFYNVMRNPRVLKEIEERQSKPRVWGAKEYRVYEFDLR
jgi:hypothetical protein